VEGSKSTKRKRLGDDVDDEGSSRKVKSGVKKGKRTRDGKRKAGSSSKKNLTAYVKPLGPVVQILLKVSDFLSYLTWHSNKDSLLYPIVKAFNNFLICFPSVSSV